MSRLGGDGGGDLAVVAGKVAEVNVEDGFVGGIGVEFGVDDGDSAEEEIGDVSEDGGAAGGDEVGGQELVELGEGVVDAHCSGEFVGVGGEESAEVGWIPGRELRSGVFGA